MGKEEQPSVPEGGLVSANRRYGLKATICARMTYGLKGQLVLDRGFLIQSSARPFKES
jgi:hypothetical protein